MCNQGFSRSKMEIKHEIQIDNFSQNESVTYPLVIIKGHVRDLPPSCCQSNAISFNNIHSAVINNRFKVLYELESGQNFISIKYCCISLELCLNYNVLQLQNSVLPLYIICDGHDGQFQAPSAMDNSIESALNRITLGAKLIQCVTAEKLYEENFGRKTFCLEDTCRVFYSKLNYLHARKMSQQDLWSALGRELANSELGNTSRKFLAFLSCTKYNGDKFSQDIKSHEDIINITEAYVALGGGGLALFGSHCLYSWPEKTTEVINCFQNENVIDKSRVFDDSCYRSTFGTCFSTTLGSVLHELCHTFDLGHTENGIMGRGFDNIDNVFVLTPNNERHGKLALALQNTIEFKEEFEPERLSERLKEKKKESYVKEREKFEDYTFWSKSCAAFLAYHKWFNDYPPNDKVLKYDPVARIINSTAGLRVAQVRNEDDGMVLDYWIFNRRVLQHFFQVPQIGAVRRLLVAEDNVGNILKELIEF